MTEISFKGKEFVYNHHLAVPHRPLVADGEKSVGEANLGGNLIIQGDNLHALKSLLPVYAGKVDCIFIDPPYNTGNENWSYNDRVNAPMIKEWLEDNPIGIEDGLRHDKWCAMMWPRLKLLHELLSETGSLWMTLDSNESHRGKLLLDEIFGEENFIGELIWRKKEGGGQTVAEFVTEHDYIIGFKKTEALRWFDEIIPIDEKDYKYELPDGTKYRSVKLEKWGADARAEDRPTMVYPIKDLADKNFLPIAPDEHPGRWRVGSKKMDLLKKEGLIEWKKDGKGRMRPFEIVPFKPDKNKTIKERSILLNAGTSGSASKLLTSIFGKKDVFNNPKPPELLSMIFGYLTDKNSVILDSFAGSGTTAHSVLKANAEDGGNRKFILVEMEEDIADPVTAERVRRVINGYSHDGKTTEGLGGAFTYCTLGESIDLNRILSGVALPSYEEIAPVLFYMATNETLKPDKMRPDDFYVGASLHDHVWMIYRPNLEWLKSDEAALSLSKANKIFKTDPKKRHLVFAPARFVSEKVLKEEGINVAFVPFPDSLYQVVRE